MFMFCIVVLQLKYLYFCTEMSNDNDDVFFRPSYLEDNDLFPYNTEHFAQCDPAVQLQWCLDLQSEIQDQIEALKKHAFNAKQKHEN